MRVPTHKHQTPKLTTCQYCGATKDLYPRTIRGLAILFPCCARCYEREYATEIRRYLWVDSPDVRKVLNQ